MAVLPGLIAITRLKVDDLSTISAKTLATSSIEIAVKPLSPKAM